MSREGLVQAVLGETASTVAAGSGVSSFRRGGGVPKVGPKNKWRKPVKALAGGGKVDDEEAQYLPAPEEEAPDDQAAPQSAPAAAPEAGTPLTPEEIERMGLPADGPAEGEPLSDEEIKKLGLNPEGPGHKETSGVGAFAREAAKSVVPGLAGMAAAPVGVALGALTSPVTGPVGPFVGGVGAYGLAAYGARKAQDAILEKLGLTDPEQAQADESEHPYLTAAGSLVGGGVGFNPAKQVPMAARLLGAGGMGAFEAGQEAATGQDFDPGQIAMAVAAGAVLGGPNRLGQAAESLGTKAAGMIPHGRPDMKPADQKALPKPADFTTSSEGETAPYTGGDDQTFPENYTPPRPGTEAEGARPILETQKNAGGTYETVSSPGTRAPEETLPSAETTASIAEKTPDNIAADKLAGGKSLSATSDQIANSQSKPAPSLTVGNEIGNIQSRPVSDRAAGKQDAMQYRKSGKLPDTAPTMTEGQYSPDVMAATNSFTNKGEEAPPVKTGIPVPQEPHNAPATGTVTARNQQLEGPPKPTFHDNPKAVERPEVPEGTNTKEPAPEHPAVLQRAAEVAKLAREAGMEKVAAAIEKHPEKADQAAEHLEEYRQQAEAMQAAQKQSEARPVVKGVDNAPKGKSEEDVRRKSKEVSAAQEAFDKFPPKSDQIPTKAADAQAFQQRIRDAVAHFDANVEHPDLDAARAEIKRSHPDWDDAKIQKAVAKLTTRYQPNERTAAQLWVDKARKLAALKTPPSIKRMTDFISEEKQLRSGDKQDVQNVRQTGRIEGDIAMSRRSGEAATDAAEAGRARQREIDDLSGTQERGEFPGDLVHDEDPDTMGWGRHEPVTEKEMAELHEHSALARNLNGLDHEAMLERAKGESVRKEFDNGPKVKVETGGKQHWEEQAAARAAKIAEQKAARLARNSVQGKHMDETKPVSLKELGKQFLSNESGSVDPVKVGQWFKAQSKPYADWYAKTFEPHRVGEMGSTSRDNALRANAAIRDYNIRMAQGNNHYIRAMDAEHKAFESRKPDGKTKLSEQDWKNQNLEFMKNMEYGTKQDQDKPWMQQADTNFRKYFKTAYDIEKAAGSKADFVENYFSHMWEDNTKAKEWLNRMAQNFGPTWFQKHRTIDLIEEGIKAGLKLKSYNPAEIVTRRMMASVSMQNKMWLLGEMKRMGLAHRLAEAPNSVKSVRSEWKQIDAPDQNRWALSPDIQPLWNNVMEGDSLWQKEGPLGSMFRGWMRAKTIWVPIKLALSAFHLLHVSHIHMNQTALQGWAGEGMQGYLKNMGLAVKDIGVAGHDAFRAVFQPKTPFDAKFEGTKALQAFGKGYDENATQMEKDVSTNQREGGFHAGMPEHFKVRAQRDFDKAWNEGRALSVAGNAIALGAEKIPVLSHIQNFMFEHWIPSLKAAAYERGTAALMKRDPTLNFNDDRRRVAKAEIAKQIDERYGEMFYGNLMWNKAVKDTMIGADLSLGWNLGLLHTTAGAAAEGVRTGGARLGVLPKRSALEQTMVDAKNKGAYIASYAITAGLATAAMSYALSGEPPTSKLDWAFPRAGGTNPDGSPRRLSTMFYTREPFQLAHHVEEQDSYVGGLAQMLWNKMILAPIVEQYHNKDYYGYQVRDPNASGPKQVYQSLKSLLGDLFTPISYGGAQKAQQTGGGLRDKALAYAGFSPAPGYIAKSALQNRIAHLYYEGAGAETKPYENRDRDAERRDARADLAMAQQNKDSAAASAAMQRLVKTGLKPGAVAQQTYGTQDKYQFGRLDDTTQAALVKTMTPDEFRKYGLGKWKLIKVWKDAGKPWPLPSR